MRLVPLLALSLGSLSALACRSEHGLDRPPPGYVEPPPVERTQQRVDPKTGKVTHAWNEITFPNRPPVKHGIEAKFSSNGVKVSEGQWNQGKKTGTWRFYYASGVLKSETIYAGPKTPAQMTFWHENGRVMLQGPALDGSRHGRWRHWTNAGLLAEEGEYQGSQREGTWKIYNADGTQVTDVVYSKNRRVSLGETRPCEPVRLEAVP